MGPVQNLGDYVLARAGRGILPHLIVAIITFCPGDVVPEYTATRAGYFIATGRKNFTLRGRYDRADLAG